MLPKERCVRGKASCREVFADKRAAYEHEVVCGGRYKHRLFVIAGICAYCVTPLLEHAEGKCLYEPTCFKSVRISDACDECVRYVGVRQGLGYGPHSAWGNYCDCLLGRVVRMVDP